MEDLKVQQNLEENIKKVIEKIREEGNKGINVSNKSYPIEVEITVEKTYNFDTKIGHAETEIVIKNYNNYMKLIQTLDTLINMYSTVNVKDFGVSDRIKIKIEEQIEIIQNTGLQSLDKNYISQYSCLIKCYDSLLRMDSRFVRRNVSSLPQYSNNITINGNVDKNNIDTLVNKIKRHNDNVKVTY